MDSYIINQLAVAKELLETGVELSRPQCILKAIHIYDNLKSLSEDAKKNGKNDYYENVTENMVRACSAMCVFDPPNAKNYLDKAKKFDEDHPVINNNYGFVYHTQYGDWDKSISHYEKCLFKDPTYLTAYLGVIDVYRTLRHHKIELEYCKKALKNLPDSAEVYNSLGLAMLHNHLYDDISKILHCFSKGLSLNPSPETKCKLFVNIGHVHGIVGDFSLAVHHYLQAIEADPRHHPAYQNILLNLHYFSDMDFHDTNLKATMKKFGVVRNKGETIADIISKLHVAIVEEIYAKKQVTKTGVVAATFPPRPKLNKKTSTAEGKVETENETDVVATDINAVRKINIAYLSADLVDHAVSFFSKTLFSHYNKECFNVYIYANNVYDPDAIAALQCTGYRCVKNASTADVCLQLEKDSVDILIDLSSHTSGNRLDVIAARPTPVILSYLGYPDDTGFPFVRRISDVFTEKCNRMRYEHGCLTAPIRLNRLFLCYTGKNMEDKYIKSYSSFKPKESIVNFGCFAKLQKINKHVISAWMEILAQVPNSRILLKSRYFQDPSISKEWRNKFKTETRDFTSRVVLLKGTATAEQHMQLFKMIDIQLDTFPYSGTTITTESLYMNVPVITLALYARSVGHVTRVSGSILQSMGLEKDLVASNVNEYVQKAVALVDKLPHFPSVRKRFLSTSISKPKEFMEHFEEALCQEYLSIDSE